MNSSSSYVFLLSGGFLDEEGWDSLGILMNGFLVVCNITPLILAIFGVYERIDPFYLFLIQFLESTLLCRSFSFVFLRFSCLLLAMAEVWKQIGFFSLSCLLVLQIVSKALFIKTAGASQITYKRDAKTRLQIQWRFNQACLIYKKLQIIIYAGINPSLIYFIPYFMALGLILCILCDFTTITLHSTMNMALLIVMLGISFGVKFIILTLLPQACDVHDEALQFKTDWNSVAPIGNKLSRKVLRSLMPLRFYAGTFFFCKRTTKTTYFSVIMHYTITAVISINSNERSVG